MSEERWTYELRGQTFELPVDLPAEVFFAFGKIGVAMQGSDTEQAAAGAYFESATRALFGEEFDRLMSVRPSINELVTLFGQASQRGVGAGLGERSALPTSSNGGAEPSQPTSPASTGSISTPS